MSEPLYIKSIEENVMYMPILQSTHPANIIQSVEQLREICMLKTVFLPLVKTISETMENITDDELRNFLDELQKEFKPV